MNLLPFNNLKKLSQLFMRQIRSVVNFSFKSLTSHFEHRVLIYLAHGLMVNGATYLSFWVYERWNGDEIWLPFQGMYALQTSLNFTICFILVMELWLYLTKSRSPSYLLILAHLCLISFIGLIIGYLLQRTLVYSATRSYYPELIEFHRMYPYTRPRFLRMFGWFFLTWLPLLTLLTFIACRLERNQHPAGLELTSEQIPQEQKPLFLEIHGMDYCIKYNDITHISMEDHYARIYWIDGDAINETLVRKSLKKIKDELPEDQFLQIHRSHLVNLNHIGGLIREGRKWSIPMGTRRLPVSRDKLPRVKEIISGTSC